VVGAGDGDEAEVKEGEEEMDEGEEEVAVGEEVEEENHLFPVKVPLYKNIRC
jgi:hypothetical protein